MISKMFNSIKAVFLISICIFNSSCNDKRVLKISKLNNDERKYLNKNDIYAIMIAYKDKPNCWYEEGDCFAELIVCLDQDTIRILSKENVQLEKDYVEYNKGVYERDVLIDSIKEVSLDKLVLIDKNGRFEKNNFPTYTASVTIFEE